MLINILHIRYKKCPKFKDFSTPLMNYFFRLSFWSFTAVYKQKNRSVYKQKNKPLLISWLEPTQVKTLLKTPKRNVRFFEKNSTYQGIKDPNLDLVPPPLLDKSLDKTLLWLHPDHQHISDGFLVKSQIFQRLDWEDRWTEWGLGMTSSVKTGWISKASRYLSK